jgi:hypothetical protein
MSNEAKIIGRTETVRRSRRGKRPIYGFRKNFKTLGEGVFESIDLVPRLNGKVFKSIDSFIEQYVEGDGITRNTIREIKDDTVVAHIMFDMCVKLINEQFPSMADEDYPNTLNLSIRGDNFYFRSKDDVSISWEYNHNSIINGDPFITFTIILTEPRNIMLLKTLKGVEENLKKNGWEYFEPMSNSRHSALQSHNRRRYDNKLSDNVHYKQQHENVAEAIAQDMKKLEDIPEQQEVVGVEMVEDENQKEVSIEQPTHVDETASAE